MKAINVIIAIAVAMLYAIAVGFIVGGVCAIAYGVFNGYAMYPLFVGLILSVLGVSVWLALQRQ